MKNLFILLITASVVFITCGTKEKKDPQSLIKSETISSFSSIAVLELFTSEGCSSCPPADRLLAQLLKTDSNIYVLAFHVDYWDRLGWKDQFSSSEFTERQKDYGTQFRLESIYTPQLVINGKYEMVGSNKTDAQNAIQKVLKERPLVSIKIIDVKINDHKIDLSYSLDGNWQHTNLLAILVQKEAVVNVKAGENKGAQLSHTNVVRLIKKLSSAQSGRIDFTKPDGLNDNNWQVILLTQGEDGTITGAARGKQ
jgi:hypothetical protein